MGGTHRAPWQPRRATARFRGVWFTIFASMSGLSWSPNTTCPGRCTSWSPPCLPSARRHIEPVTGQPGRALLAGVSSLGKRVVPYDLSPFSPL